MPSTVQNYQQGSETITEPNLLLLEFWQEFDTTKHRAVMNNEDVVFDGETYVRSAMEITLPNDGDVQQTTSITFSNVDRILGRFALNAVGKIICRMIIVDGYDYTIVSDVRNYATALMDTQNMMTVSKIDVNVLTISGDLTPKLDLQTPYPVNKTNANAFPGIFL